MDLPFRVHNALGSLDACGFDFERGVSESAHNLGNLSRDAGLAEKIENSPLSKV